MTKMAAMAHGLTPTPGNALRLARIHCQGMRELIESNPAHWEDEQALGVMRGLCKRALAVMTDPVCRAYLAAIDDFAAALPWASEHGWSPGRMFGPWFIRREVLRKLRMLADRLTELELDGTTSDQEVRRAMAAKELHAGAGAAPRRERYANVLRTAADAVGGVPRFARVLRVAPEELERWLDGTGEAPLEVFLASLDLVAAGPREVAAPRAGWGLDRAVVPTLLGAALIAAACLFASLPLKAALPLVAWLCIVAILLAWCASATRNASAQVRTVGQAAVLVTVCFLGASLVYRSADPLPVPARTPTPKAIDLPLAAAPAAITPAKPHRPSASPPKVVQAALGTFPSTAHAAAGASAPAAFDDACAALTGVASLQCLRCANEGLVSRLLCQERARLEYCQRREGLESQCPSAIP
ncbi:MAG TPA: hypothetical protein VLI89_14760, partial [Burkholderiales bacterium]|nr:hypothetical protein [Burkholderiales bacterium]